MSNDGDDDDAEPELQPEPEPEHGSWDIRHKSAEMSTGAETFIKSAKSGPWLFALETSILQNVSRNLDIGAPKPRF